MPGHGAAGRRLRKEAPSARHPAAALVLPPRARPLPRGCDSQRGTCRHNAPGVQSRRGRSHLPDEGEPGVPISGPAGTAGVGPAGRSGSRRPVG